MTKLGVWLPIVTAWSLSLACGERRMEDPPAGSGGASGTTTDLMSTSSESSSDDATSTPPLECREGWTACPGEEGRLECTSLFGDPGNCGECGHGCRGHGAGPGCSNYQCLPGLWPCIPRDPALATCSQACASVGESCASDAYCSGYAKIWLTDSTNDDDPQDELEDCAVGWGDDALFELGCNDPIDWDSELNGRTVVGIACCCTQP